MKGKKKTKLPKRKTSAQLKRELDKVFSEYVRKSAERDGLIECYTCGARKEMRYMHAGHFVSRVYLATRFDERNVRPQCVGCNIFGNGQQVEFARRLEIEEPGVTAELLRQAQKVTKDFPYAEMIANYKRRLSEL